MFGIGTAEINTAALSEVGGRMWPPGRQLPIYYDLSLSREVLFDVLPVSLSGTGHRPELICLYGGYASDLK